MGFKKNNPGCNCCSTTCTICSGNCGWTAVTGSIDTASFSPDLLIDGSNTIATCDAAASAGTISERASVTVVAESGDECKLGIKYTDTSNYWYVELTPGTSGTLKLFERSGGTTTQRGPTLYVPVAGDMTYGLTICYGSGLVRATESVSGISVTYATTTSSTTGTKAFLGTGTISGAPLFSEFIFEYGYYSSGHSTCTDCECPAACEIWSTAFTGSDSSDISQGDPAGFIVQNGLWDITSNQLRCTSAGGLVLLNTQQPCGSIAMVVGVTMKHSNSTATVDIIFGANSSTDYWYARCDFDLDTVSIRRNNGGSHSTIKTVSSVVFSADGTTYDISVCVTPAGNVTVKRGASYLLTAFAQPITGTMCGLATSAATATFDNFSFYQSERSDGDGCEVCRPVPATCADCCIDASTEFVLDWVGNFTSITCAGNCETLSTGEYSLTGSAASCSWTYSVNPPGPDCGCADGRTQAQQMCGSQVGDGGTAPTICINLQTLLDTSTPPKCYLRLRVQVQNVDASITGCVNDELLSANYESDSTAATFDACTGDEITLYKVDPGTITTTYRGNTGWLDEYTAGCTGSLPATVTVRAV